MCVCVCVCVTLVLCLCARTSVAVAVGHLYRASSMCCVCESVNEDPCDSVPALQYRV